MSRLNAVIKLVVTAGNLFLILFSGLFVIGSSLVLSGTVTALNFRSAKELSVLVLIIACAVFSCTVWGCCGAINQVIRKGLCSGRRILCFHQFSLITLLIFSCSEYSVLSKRLKSISLVMANIEDYRTYDKFETKISQYFNNAYFDGHCAQRPLDSWIIQWIDKECPVTMSQESCALNEIQKYTCDTTCFEPVWNKKKCCPSEKLCFQEKMNEACPYQQCRLPALKAVYSWMSPFTLCIQFISYLSGVMIIFTVLLICYNPRDDIEIELLKTGVMTQQQMESIRELRTSNKLSFSNGRPSIIFDGNDIVANGAKINKKTSTRKRKSGARVSPHQHSNEQV